jgi:hypothetical protein
MENQSKTVLNRKTFPGTNKHIPGLYWLFIDGIRMMASEYEELRKELPDFVDVPDEVVLCFDDAETFSSQLLKAGVITSEHFDLVNKINSLIDEIPHESYEWEPSKQMEVSIWIKCREIARDLLKLLGEKLPEDY